VLSTFPGFIPPCLPTKAKEPPRGSAWIHEIKHDGFRVIARKEGNRVRLYTRNGWFLQSAMSRSTWSSASRSVIIPGPTRALAHYPSHQLKRNPITPPTITAAIT
jgi:hypothetical protein